MPIHLDIGCLPTLCPYIRCVTLRHVISLFVFERIRNNATKSRTRRYSECDRKAKKMPTICLQSASVDMEKDRMSDERKKSERETQHSWLDPKQTKPTKLKVNEAKNELTHNITFDNRNKVVLSLSFSRSRTKLSKVKRDKTTREEIKKNELKAKW